MGATVSNQTRQVKQPQDIAEFRKLTGPTDYLSIPEVPEKRRVTDFKFTIIFAVCIAVLVPFLIYTFVQSDLDRFFRGYDKCGNICGLKNDAVDGVSCSGKDEIASPLLKYTSQRTSYDDPYIAVSDYECVSSCDSSSYTIILNRCFPTEGTQESQFLSKLADDINRSAGHIVALCFIGLGLSILMLILFRYFTAVVVWTMLIGSLIGLVALTGFAWYLYKESTEENSKPLLYTAIIVSAVTLFLAIILFVMIKKIKLVIRLFKESIKIIFGIPLILAEPLLTLLANAILLAIFGFFLFVWGTAGSLEHVSFDVYDYVPNGVILFTIYFHCVICFWMSQFILGCQHMVISGAVSAYYFARDKSTVTSPIYNSFYNLIRYHLGTVAFGSLLITLIAILKALLRSLSNNKYFKAFVDCCMGFIEDFLKYLSKNAYIQTAMHGQPFYKSGKRAVRLLVANALSAIAVNSVGDFVLGMAKLLIIVSTVGIGCLIRDKDIENFWAAVVIAAIVTAIIAHAFFAVFETAVDTLFLCFCEDSCMNDGMDRPYYMTTDLMQYVEDAKKATRENERQ